MTFKTISSEADLAEGMEWLGRNEPRFEEAFRRTGPLPLRRRPGGFAALLDAIVSQQLSVAAADTISKRLKAIGADDPRRLLEIDEADLRNCGLSRPKVRYAMTLAAADLDYGAFEGMSDEEVIRRLVAVRGIGLWTAEIYLMFSLGRTDAIAAGDLALQESARILFDLPCRPNESEFRKLSAAWSPWRAVAARLLWAYYRVARRGEGIR